MQEDGKGPGVHRERAKPEQVRGDARQFTADDTDILTTLRQLVINAQQFFHGQYIVDIIGQRRQVIEPVGVGNELGVGHVLSDFFIAAMQITHVRFGPDDGFTIHLNLQSQHPVRGRMRWSHVEHHFLTRHIG